MSDHLSAHHWVLGPVAAAVIAAAAFAETPPPALHGSGLFVAISLAVLIAAMALAARQTVPRARMLAPVVAAVLAACTLAWLQPTATGIAGLFVAVSLAAMRLRATASLAAFALAAAVFAGAAVHGGRSAGAIAAAELGIVAFYLVVAFARRTGEARDQTERVLAELEATRDAQAEAATLRERGRLAREMHDVLAHSLSALMLQLEGARLLSTGADADVRLPETLDRAHHLARAGLEEARRAIGALRDEELPGPDRLRQLVAEFERDCDVRTALRIDGAPRRLDSESALTVYRVAQEALTNVRKHAAATRVEVRLSYEADGTRLTVRDHSSHRASQGPSGHGYGLTGMRERAELLGGWLHADHTPDGFQVELWVPS